MENINRSMTDEVNVRTPDGRGTVHTLISDKSVIVHNRPFRCVLSSENQTIRIIIESI